MNTYSILLKDIKIAEPWSQFVVLPKTRQELGIEKLVTKLPMCNRVIDDKHDLYAFIIEDGIVKYLRLGNCKPLSNG